MAISQTAISANFLAEPRRQSGIALVFYVVKFLRITFRTLWPLLLIYLVNSNQESGNTFWLPIILGISGFRLLSSIIAYFRFYYHAKDGELVIERGVFQKVRLNIPFERIQTINFNQNILHQFLNVYEVRIETAGSAGTELSIEALDKATAEAIRDFVMHERSLILEQSAEELEENAEGLDSPHQQQAPELLFKRSNLELLKIGISENHVQTFFIILGFCFGWLQFGDDFIDIDYTELAIGAVEMIGGMVSMALAALIFVLAIVTIGVSLIRTIIRYHGLSVYESQSGFKIVAGLFNRKEQAAPYQKIQFMKWAINPIQKLMDFRTIRLFQASSTSVSRSRALPIPGSSKQNLDALLRKLFPPEDREGYQEIPISPLIIGRRVLWLGVLPALLMILQGVSISHIGLIVFAVFWPALIWVLARRFHSLYRLYLNEQILEVHSGLFGRKYTLLRLFKVQAIELSQSPYQRRKAVSDLELHTAARVIKIPYLPLETAREIRDYILYEVEREERDWM